MMNTIKSEQLLAQMNWRYATQLFDPARKISPEDWAAMALTSVVCCATGYRSAEDKSAGRKKVRFARTDVIHIV
jgi:hypothetical protein